MTLKNQLVMVVEDTYDDRQLVSTILEHSGIKVALAKNGTECLKLLENQSPALIVTDLAMPEMDGWDMLKQLRANPETDSIPVVVVTAYYSVETARDAVEAGFNGYFSKPVNPAEFVNSLERILENISLP